MAQQVPGQSDRDGMTLIQMMDMFPTDEVAARGFEECVWPGGERNYGKCGSINIREVSNAKPMSYWCTDCRSHFSVRTGASMARSNIPMRKWAIGIHLRLSGLKSVSGMKLHRDLGISQPSAWSVMHRIREAWACDEDVGPIDAQSSSARPAWAASSATSQVPNAKWPRDASGRPDGDRGCQVPRFQQGRHQDGTVNRQDHPARLVGDMADTDTVACVDDAIVFQGIPISHKIVKHAVSE